MNSAKLRASLLVPLILIISLFFLWGMANHLNDILITQFKKIFTLSDFRSSLVQMAFYFGYFVFAIPAAIYMKRFGYKSGVVLGLLLYGAGAFLFYPAAQVKEYYLFLTALFVIASGLAFLETSANPLIIAMGDPETAARRLNFAQSFNPLGALAGILIGREFILSGIEHSEEELAALSAIEITTLYEMEIQAVQGPYLLLGALVLVWALLVFLTRFPTIAQQAATSDESGNWQDFKKLLQHKLFLFGVIAQFFYVGAQVCVFSFIIRYGQEALPKTGEKTLATYVFFALVAFMVGRFVATALMSKVKASRLMAIFAYISMLLCLVAFLLPNMLGMFAFASISFFMSLMFPTIFALSMKGLGPLSKVGSSLLVMAIVGGAVLTALMGFISDLSSIHHAVVVPFFCFGVIAWFARRCHQRDRLEINNNRGCFCD